MFPVLIFLFIFSIAGIINAIGKGKKDAGLFVLFSAMLIVTSIAIFVIVQDLLDSGVPLI